jgi:hypothetical protein
MPDGGEYPSHNLEISNFSVFSKKVPSWCMRSKVSAPLLCDPAYQNSQPCHIF